MNIEKSITDTKIINTIIGIFLLIIAVSGNFIAETLSCQSQKLLSENMIAKNIVILTVIYFALDFTQGEKSISPSELLSRTLLIWLFFLIFNKMDIQFTIFVFFCLLYILQVKTYCEYYQYDKNKKNIIKKLKPSIDFVLLLIVITLIIGFSIYFNKQYRDHKKDFSIFSFIFGKTKCNSKNYHINNS